MGAGEEGGGKVGRRGRGIEGLCFVVIIKWMGLFEECWVGVQNFERHQQNHFFQDSHIHLVKQSNFLPFQ